MRVFAMKTPIFTPLQGVSPALNQNRTDDLILTMDVLCQLSYKGIDPTTNGFGDNTANLHILEKILKKGNFVKGLSIIFYFFMPIMY